jgi:FtsH-binding integral membrane protein
VNLPTPAIVAQSAVRRLPRWALLMLCGAYLLAGYLGREPWKSADITGFGYMLELARTAPWDAVTWLAPRIPGSDAPAADALLPYWLGAWAVAGLPLPSPLAARLPFLGLLALAMASTWYAVYHLALTPRAQPVSFAFGGEARPKDYARAIADGALLALLACLGLAQLSHETTPAVAQLGFAALLMFGVARTLPPESRSPWPAILALPGLALSGAPALATLLGLGTAGILAGSHPMGEEAPRSRRVALVIAACTLLTAGLCGVLGLWRWRLELPETGWAWRNILRLFVWFTWPAWPLALWSLWRWRLQLRQAAHHPHLALPLLFAVVASASAVFTPTGDRSLLLALPALATLAAFALPTLERSVAALIDWFTLIFFSACTLIIWVVWTAMQTGFPPQPAANVARLAPGFEPSFVPWAFVVALLATFGWVRLIAWRAGRHRAAIWKSLALPAGGAVLCWVLLMTLWLPLLDYARSYAPLVRRIQALIGTPECVAVAELTPAQAVALRFHGQLELRQGADSAACPWLIVDDRHLEAPVAAGPGSAWARVASIQRPSDNNEFLTVFRRVPAQP